MEFYPNAGNGLIMKAAQMALVTGNANYILIWVPEESENTLKNLLEKTCCEHSARKNMQNRAVDWYFDTVSRFYSANKGALHSCLKFGDRDESTIVPMMERAIETGNFEEIIGIIPNIHAAEVRERFHHVMDKSNYDRNNIAAGRAYISAFIDFLTYVHTIRTCIPGEENHS
jgi:cell division inhibitor SulA